MKNVVIRITRPTHIATIYAAAAKEMGCSNSEVGKHTKVRSITEQTSMVIIIERTVLPHKDTWTKLQKDIYTWSNTLPIYSRNEWSWGKATVIGAGAKKPQL